MATPELPRVLCTGSQTYENRSRVFRVLDEVLTRLGPFVLVHGGCPRGADNYFSQWAANHETLGIEEEVHVADWFAACDDECSHGPRRKAETSNRDFCQGAGFRRSRRMVRKGAVECHSFNHNNSPGTRYCASRAEAAGIRVIPHPESASGAAA